MKIVLFILALPLSLLAQAVGGEPFSTSPAVLLAQAQQFNPPGKHAATVLLQEWRYRFDNQGRAHLTNWTVYRIVSLKDADDWAEVDQPWSSWRQKRPVIRARVITPDGSAHPLDPKTIEEVSDAALAANLYSDRKRLRAPLPSAGDGALVEAVTEVEDTEPLFGTGQARQVLLAGGVPHLQTRLVIDAPKQLPLHYVVRLAPGLQPRRTDSGDRLTLVFETGPSDAVQLRPPNLPSDVPRWPSVTFSTGESWTAVANRFGKAVDEQIGAEDLRGLLPPLPAGASREQIAGTLVTYLHEKVRYTGVEFGEAAWVPGKPMETLKRGFGDCKDKAAVLIAMLRAAGLDARLALLNTGPGMDVEPEAPGLGMFDHAIVYVPGQPALWIDATDQWARPGQLGAMDQDRYALILGERTSGLVRTPGSTPADNRTVENREFFLPALGTARVVETMETWGGDDLSIRSAYATADQEALRKGYERYGEVGYLSKKLAAFEHRTPEDFSGPFRVKAEFVGAGRGVVGESEAVVAIPRAELFERLPPWLRAAPPENSGVRTEDAELHEPFTVEWRYRIVPPAGFRVRELPPPADQKLGRAAYSHTFQTGEDGVVTGALRFETGGRRMTAGEARALREGVVQISSAPPLLISFDQSGEKLLAEGKIREALAEFRRLSAAEPKEPVHRTRISRALLAAGVGEAARQQAR
jgi:transglutaminase-like putative cysteine protease